jgi:hypothetical protein
MTICFPATYFVNGEALKLVTNCEVHMPVDAITTATVRRLLFWSKEAEPVEMVETYSVESAFISSSKTVLVLHELHGESYSEGTRQ